MPAPERAEQPTLGARLGRGRATMARRRVVGPRWRRRSWTCGTPVRREGNACAGAGQRQSPRSPDARPSPSVTRGRVTADSAATDRHRQPGVGPSPGPGRAPGWTTTARATRRHTPRCRTTPRGDHDHDPPLRHDGGPLGEPTPAGTRPRPRQHLAAARQEHRRHDCRDSVPEQHERARTPGRSFVPCVRGQVHHTRVQGSARTVAGVDPVATAHHARPTHRGGCQPRQQPVHDELQAANHHHDNRRRPAPPDHQHRDRKQERSKRRTHSPTGHVPASQKVSAQCERQRQHGQGNSTHQTGRPFPGAAHPGRLPAPTLTVGPNTAVTPGFDTPAAGPSATVLTG